MSLASFMLALCYNNKRGTLSRHIPTRIDHPLCRIDNLQIAVDQMYKSMRDAAGNRTILGPFEQSTSTSPSQQPSHSFTFHVFPQDDQYCDVRFVVDIVALNGLIVIQGTSNQDLFPDSQSDDDDDDDVNW